MFTKINYVHTRCGSEVALGTERSRWEPVGAGGTAKNDLLCMFIELDIIC